MCHVVLLFFALNTSLGIIIQKKSKPAPEFFFCCQCQVCFLSSQIFIDCSLSRQANSDQENTVSSSIVATIEF